MDKNAIKAKYEAEKERLKQKSIKDVAESLGMQFDGIEWTEHRSFKLDLKKIPPHGTQMTRHGKIWTFSLL